MINYTARDMGEMLQVLPAFAVVLLAPGYCVGRLTEVFSFRRRDVPEQILWSLALSSAVSPILLSLAGRVVTHSSIAYGCLLVALLACGEIGLRWKRAGMPLRFAIRRSTVAALGLAALWTGVCFLSLPDLQKGNKLYPTAAVADLGVRSALVGSAMRDLPPDNPFFDPGQPVRLRYYYYWYVVCAVPAKLSAVAPRAALFASCVWSGWLIAAVLALSLKYLFRVHRNLRGVCVAGMALLAVNGLDLVYTTWLYLKDGAVLHDTEIWDTAEVTSWVNSLLWVPHHVASLAACVVGLMMLWQAGPHKEISTRQRVLLGVLAAMAFASASGLSVYVTLAFAFFLLASGIYWIARREFGTLGLYIGVGAMAILLSVPYLRELLAPTVSHAAAATPGFAELTLRHLPPTADSELQRLLPSGSFSYRIVRAMLLPAVYLLEFGFFFVVAIRQWSLEASQRAGTSPSSPAALESRDLRWHAWLMLAAGMFFATFLRSVVTVNNDLSMRGVLVAQFVLLAWGAMQLEGLFGSHSSFSWRALRADRLGALLLCIGLATSLNQLTMLRIFFPGSDLYGWSSPIIPGSEFRGRVGEINLQVREAYNFLDTTLPASAKVQFGAAPRLNLQHLYYSRFQHLDAFEDCGIPFGGTPEGCLETATRLEPLFGSAMPGSRLLGRIPPSTIQSLHNPVEASRLCRRLGIDAVVVTGEDPVWNDPEAWVHHLKPNFATNFVAVYLFPANGPQSSASI